MAKFGVLRYKKGLNVNFSFSSPTGILFMLLLFMAALCNRARHDIFALWFLSFFLLSFFFPRLISAAADRMSTILPHMVWP